MGKYILDDIVTIIVLYNCSCLESTSYKNLKENGVRVIVCDNSTRDYGNKNIVESDGYIYINMNGNKGLSKAYNAALNQISDDCQFICLFDDDTNISKEYFDKSLEYMNVEEADIFLPIVKTETKVLSPCQFKNKKVIEVRNSNEIDKKYISGINSGIIIRKTVFDDFKYNENIFLDYIDHYFMKEMVKRHKEIKIMEDNILYQDFSIENNTLESAYKRLCILNHDLKEFYRGDYLTYFIQITAYKLVMIKKFKTLKFFYLKNIDSL